MGGEGHVINKMENVRGEKRHLVRGFANSTGGKSKGLRQEEGVVKKAYHGNGGADHGKEGEALRA